MLSILFSILGNIQAQEITVREAEVKKSNSDYFLSASFDIKLSEALEVALRKGVTLYFVLDFQLGNRRWYSLFLWNVPVVKYSQAYGLSFNGLTRNYRLAYGGLHQSFENLNDALAVLGKVGRPRVIGEHHLKEGRNYIAQLRMRLDKSRLPKPFQINAIGSSEWSLSSKWYFWQVIK